MRCPFCGHDDTQVKDSRPSDDNAAIRRRRLCPGCGGRFTTFERVQLRELTVIKKAGDAAKICGPAVAEHGLEYVEVADVPGWQDYDFPELRKRS